MDSLTSHPSTAEQAKAFTAPHSLSYPGGYTDAAGNITPPSSEKDGQGQQTSGRRRIMLAVPTVTRLLPTASPPLPPLRLQASLVVPVSPASYLSFKTWLRRVSLGVSLTD